jgi:hypothetical protein
MEDVMRRILRYVWIAALAAMGCGGSNKAQPAQLTSAQVPSNEQRINGMQLQIARLEKDRDDARRAADQERNRHVQYVLLQQERNDLEDRAWARLAEIDGFVLKLEEKANAQTGVARARFESEVADAAKKREAIEHDLRRVHTETDQRFERLKRELERRLDDLYTSVRVAAERK